MIDKSFGRKIMEHKYTDREGAYLICVENNAVAVVKTPKGFFLPGGGIDCGESHIECIERELLEETGFLCEIDKYICSAEEYLYHEKFRYFHPIQNYYCGKLTEQIVQPVETDHQLEWLPVRDIESKMYLKSQGWAIKYLTENF